MAGLIAGTLFGIWIGYNPQHLSGQTYVEQQQGVINALNILMPILGLITIILTLISAYIQRDDQLVFIALLVAAVLLITSGLVTRFGNQPINSIVMTWDKTNLPNNWIELRNKWWSLHIIRAVTALAAFCLIIWTSMRKT
jgi:hypothetical protein